MCPEKSQHNDDFYSKNYDIVTQCCDPLRGLGDTVPENVFYRVESTVFAEPLNSSEQPCSDKAGDELANNVEETTLLDNFTIRKRPGNRKKLYVDLHDSTNLNCTMQNCNKSFSSPTLLRAHIRKVHYSEKRFTCEVCGAGFTALYLLKRHSGVHGARRVQCPLCEKMLSVRTKLSAHLRSHSTKRSRGKKSPKGRMVQGSQNKATT